MRKLLILLICLNIILWAADENSTIGSNTVQDGEIVVANETENLNKEELNTDAEENGVANEETKTTPQENEVVQNTENNETKTVSQEDEVVQNTKNNETSTNLAQEDEAQEYGAIDNTENNETKEKIKLTNRKLSKFEKTFIYHVAYNHYKKAIDFMFAKNHKAAYNEAMAAKAIYDNGAKAKDITLPYIPGYIRENAQTPVRIYYKIFQTKNYELHRLIRKIKLLNPPIPMVVFRQTSTFVDIEVQNFGDLPLDKFGIEVNFEKAVVFEKVNPGESKTFRYNKAVELENIRFTEEFGFAPKDIEFEAR